MNAFSLVASHLLAAAVAAALAAILVLKRPRLRGGDRGEERLKFLGTVPLGPRERASLVAFRDRVYLLGVTGHAVTKLETFPYEEPGPRQRS